MSAADLAAAAEEECAAVDGTVTRADARLWSERIAAPMVRSNWVARLFWDSESASSVPGKTFGQHHMSAMVAHVRSSMKQIAPNQIPMAIFEVLDMLDDHSCRSIRRAWDRAYGDTSAVHAAVKPTPEEEDERRRRELSAFLADSAASVRREIRKQLPQQGGGGGRRAPGPAPAEDDDGDDPGGASSSSSSSSSSASSSAAAATDDEALERKIELTAEFNERFLCSDGKSNQYKDYLRLIALVQLNCYIRSQGSPTVSKYGSPACPSKVQKNARDAFFLFCAILWPGFASWLYSQGRADSPHFRNPKARERLRQFVDIYVGVYISRLLGMSINLADDDARCDGVERAPIDEFVEDCRYHYMLIVREEYEPDEGPTAAADD